MSEFQGPQGGEGAGWEEGESQSKRHAHRPTFLHVDTGHSPLRAGAVGGKGTAEKALESLLDFESGMRSHGLLPRVTGTYRDLLSNVGLGWIVGGGGK